MTDTRGGKRRNGGRRRKAEADKKRKCSVTISPRGIDVALVLGGGFLSRGIEIALELADMPVNIGPDAREESC